VQPAGPDAHAAGDQGGHREASGERPAPAALDSEDLPGEEREAEEGDVEGEDAEPDDSHPQGEGSLLAKRLLRQERGLAHRSIGEEPSADRELRELAGARGNPEQLQPHQRADQRAERDGADHE
jgi:hypothetical protein